MRSSFGKQPQHNDPNKYDPWQPKQAEHQIYASPESWQAYQQFFYAPDAQCIPQCPPPCPPQFCFITGPTGPTGSPGPTGTTGATGALFGRDGQKKRQKPISKRLYAKKKAGAEASA